MLTSPKSSIRWSKLNRSHLACPQHLLLKTRSTVTKGYQKVLCINSVMMKLEEFIFLGGENYKTHKTAFIFQCKKTVKIQINIISNQHFVPESRSVHFLLHCRKPSHTHELQSIQAGKAVADRQGCQTYPSFLKKYASWT